MKVPQFPAYSLMLFVGMFCCWLVAVGRPCDLLTSLVFTTTIGLLSFSTLMAMAHRPESRPFWKGFAICGWLYFLFVFAPMVGTGNAPHLLSEVFLNDLYLYATSGETFFIHELSKVTSAPRPHFVKNGHALIALLLGIGGGFIARGIAVRETPR